MSDLPPPDLYRSLLRRIKWTRTTRCNLEGLTSYNAIENEARRYLVSGEKEMT
jgi:hypothetical protein